MNTRLSEMNLPRFPLLSDTETRRLIILAKEGDAAARETLVNSNLRLVFNLVQRFSNRGYELEDLFQIGTIGLIKAIDKFDMSYDVKFSTYAVPMIIGEIRRFLRDDNPVKVSRSVKEIAHKVQYIKEHLCKELEREPTINEIAHQLNLPREEIVSALEAAQTPTSIFETLYQDDGDPIYVLDQLGTGDGEEDGGWFDQIAIKEVLMKLATRERKIILMRFYEDKTQSEVAKHLGLSQVQVSRLERQALKTIRMLMREQGCKEPIF
ncbi:MAG: RNA polymerase sporulation sigma factor SigF [Clostridia bacterium]|nr:RNA polymerase sporulation sigma factor SigF [Clostridia bacterium]